MAKSKSSPAKHAQNGTPKTSEASKTKASLSLSPPPQPQINAAALGPAGINKVSEVVNISDEVSPVVTRKEEITSLFEFHDITKAAAVERVVTLTVVLKSCPRVIEAKLLSNEATKTEEVDVMARDTWKLFSDVMTENKGKDGPDLETAVPKLAGAIRAAPSRDFSYKRSGLLFFSVAEDLAEWVVNALSEIATFTYPGEKEYSGEFTLPNVLFPASVIRSVHEQHGVTLVVHRDPTVGEGNSAYRYKCNSEAQAQLILNKGIHLGSAGHFSARPFEAKVTYEKFALYGCTGKGTAELIVKPALMRALAIENAFTVSFAEVFEAKAGHVVLTCKYPFTAARAEWVAELFDIGHFKVVYNNKPNLKPLEIFVAPTPVELGKVVGTTLVRSALETKDTAIGDTPVVLDLTAPK